MCIDIMVGETGFEPAISRPPALRTNQAILFPDIYSISNI